MKNEINPESLSRIFGNLHVYRNMNVLGNTTPAGVAQPTTVYFYKHTMPPASGKKDFIDSFRNIEQVIRQLTDNSSTAKSW